ncbi:MAG: type II secretion system F family protein [Tepidiformaceae bacterium]
MLLLYMTVLTIGAAAFTTTLYLAGFGSVSHEAAQRLSRLKSDEARGGAAGVILNLRRRANLNFGGFTLVSSNLVQRWTLDLDRAGLALNPREYFVLRIGVSVAVAFAGLLFLPLPILGIALAPLGYLGTGFWLKLRITRRTRKLESQLPELLSTIASGLRAGFGLMQALEASAEQMPAPIAVDVRRMLRDTAMGASVEQSLTNLNTRVGSPDFDIVITAILIQRSVGGNLAEILDSVAHTMRERERIRGEIRTLTAQQRMSGYVIAAIPVCLLVAFNMISPEFTGLLFSDPLGRVLLGVAGGLEVIGFLAINKIVSIEV